jgi:hypothetical protein
MSKKILLLVALFFVGLNKVDALPLSLDSVAEWGSFPRFCVNTYRWGDKFFNTYDSTYVQGSGYKFNIKCKTDSWLDYYSFSLPNDVELKMTSSPSTSVGFYLTYLAVSVGYDYNISKYFNGNEPARTRFNFQFNCSLFAADLYYTKNDVGATIKRFGQKHNLEHTDIAFHGINNNTLGLEVYYFFNHKKYSQAAAFAYSKIQKKSQGSLYAGIGIWRDSYDFDFNELDQDKKDQLPSTWDDYTYRVKSRNYALKVGYGYNWVFAPKWVLGVTITPTVGLKEGIRKDEDIDKFSVAMYNRARLSVVYNHKQWFAGLIGKMDTAILFDKSQMIQSSVLSAEVSAGYRFNLW